MANKIHIADGQTDKLVGHIHFDYLILNNHERDKQNNIEVFNFTSFADQSFSKLLTKRNRMIIPGEDGELRELTIFEAHEDPITKQVEVYTMASYSDLKKAKVIKPHKTTAVSAERHAQLALAGTEVKVGNVAFNGVRTIEFESYTNPFDYLKRIASEFDLELDFRVVIENRMLIRYADLVERVGAWRGRIVELGRDLLELRRIEKTDNIVTALHVIGPAREDGTRLEVFVEDKEALQRWGRNGQHLVDVYEPMSTGQDITLERLIQLGEAELAKRINASVSFVGGIADLENIEGMENKKIRFGDTIRIKVTSYDPPLYLEARVYKQSRDIKVKGQKQIALGDYIEYTEDEVKAIWKSLQAEIAKKVSEAQLEEYAEKKIPELTSPPDPNVYPKYIDISVSPPQMKLYDWDINDWTTVKGEKGDTGAPGEDGKGVVGSNVTYQLHTNGTTPPTGIWSGTIPAPVKGRYLWTRTITNYTDNSSVTTYSVSYIATDGQNGEDGKGISSTTTHYQISTSGSSIPTGTWSTTLPIPIKGRYLWTRVTISYTDGTNSISYSTSYYATDGQKGDKGDPGSPGERGPQGPAGKDGIAYMGQTAPSNPAINATWFETNSSGEIIAIKKWTGSGWSTTKMTQDTLSVVNLAAISAVLGHVKGGKIEAVELIGATGSFTGKVESGTPDKYASMDNGLIQSYQTNDKIRGYAAKLEAGSLIFGTMLAGVFTPIAEFNTNEINAEGVFNINADELRLKSNGVIAFDGGGSLDNASGIMRWRQSVINYIMQNMAGSVYFYANGLKHTFSADGNYTLQGDKILFGAGPSLDMGGGTTRLKQSDKNYILQNSAGSVVFYANGAQSHAFWAGGTKSGGTIKIDGKNLGMSPIDSPQILIEYIEFDVPLTPEGVKINLDETYLKTVEKFAAFPNNGTVIEKGTDYIIIAGEGVADIRFVGERVNYTGAFFADMDEEVTTANE